MYAVEYVKQRAAFGRTIADMQGIQWKIAELATEIEAARLLTYRAAAMADEGKYTKEYVPFLSMAKYYASEVAVKVSGEALQMLGAAGYMKDHPTELYYRDAKQLTIVEGTSQVQLGLIAPRRARPRHLVGLTWRENEIVTPILAQLTRGAELSADDVEAAITELFEGRVSDVQAAAFIVALRTKGETEAELAALVGTMHRFGTPVKVADGAIDTCGTGGDRSGTVNVSTMAALDCRGCGARVVKHGNRAASSQAGSADVLEELGVAIEIGPEGVAQMRRRSRHGFCFARRYHPAMRFLGPAHAEIGVPTTFNFLGPLANPARVKRQAVGVSDATMAKRMLGTFRGARQRTGARVLRRRRARRAHYHHDEHGARADRRAPARVLDRPARLRDRPLRARDSSSVATRRTTPGAPHGAVAGETGPCHDLAVLNAAATLMVAGLAADLGAGVEARPPRSTTVPRNTRSKRWFGSVAAASDAAEAEGEWRRFCSVPSAAPSIRSTTSRERRRFRAPDAAGR